MAVTGLNQVLNWIKPVLEKEQPTYKIIKWLWTREMGIWRYIADIAQMAIIILDMKTNPQSAQLGTIDSDWSSEFHHSKWIFDRFWANFESLQNESADISTLNTILSFWIFRIGFILIPFGITKLILYLSNFVSSFAK